MTLKSPEAETLGSQIAETVSESVVVYDRFEQIVYWNHASQLLYGWSSNEVIGKCRQDVFGHMGGDVDLTALRPEGPWTGTVERRDNHGKMVRIQLSVRVCQGPEDSLVGYIECGSAALSSAHLWRSFGLQGDWIATWQLDVSAAAKRLHEIASSSANSGLSSNQNVALLADLLPIIDLNATALKLFSEEEDVHGVVGNSAYSHWPVKHRDTLLEMVARAILAKHSDQPILRQNVGEDVVAVWRDGPPYTDTVSVSVQGSWQDLEAYWDLAASEQRYRNLLDNVPLPVWQVDARVMTGVIERLKSANVDDIRSHLAEHPELVEFASEAVVVTDVNRSAMKLFKGERRGNFIRGVRYLFAGTPEAGARVVMAHFAGDRNYSEEMKILTFDGELREVLFYVTFPQFPEKLDKTLIIMIDVTEQRELERQFRRLEADLAHAARVSALGELVTSIAHEVRQPLAVVATDAATARQLLIMKGTTSEKLQAIIARIQDNAHRANQVISRIRDMAVKTEPTRTLVSVNDVIREAAMLVQPEIASQHISLVTQLSYNLPLILADRVQLQQVMVNLFLNSIQAIRSHDAPRKEVRVEVTADELGHIVISVADTGGGISSNDFDKIFDSFFSRKAGGMGMGLAICRSIVANHGGTIVGENNGSDGATFTVVLPLSVPG
jgi:two-component system sensor kinase FixL